MKAVVFVFQGVVDSVAIVTDETYEKVKTELNAIVDQTDSINATDNQVDYEIYEKIREIITKDGATWEYALIDIQK